MNKLLFVIDMQNDFISGVLGTKEAEKIVAPTAEFIKNFINETDGARYIVATRDTHYTQTYLDTNEGKHLPVIHCVESTEGWEINPTIQEALSLSHNLTIIDKHHFAIDPIRLKKLIDSIEYNLQQKIDEFIFVGICTGICQASNAIVTKAFYPERSIKSIADCSACVTPETNEAALTVMNLCQIDIVR